MLKDQDIICCHSACNSDAQLSIDVYRRGVILSPGTGTARKDNMSNDQEVAQHKPNTVFKAEIGSAVAQWKSALLGFEGRRVRVSPASLRCGP